MHYLSHCSRMKIYIEYRGPSSRDTGVVGSRTTDPTLDPVEPTNRAWPGSILQAWLTRLQMPGALQTKTCNSFMPLGRKRL